MKLHSTLLTVLVAPSLIFSVSASAFAHSHRAVASKEAVSSEVKKEGFNLSRFLRAAREASFINNSIDKIRSEIRRYDINAEVQIPVELGKNLGVEFSYNYVVEGNGAHTLRKDGWLLAGEWTLDRKQDSLFNRTHPGLAVNFYSLSESRAEAGRKQIKSLQEFPDNSQDVINKMKDGERVEVVAFLSNYLGLGKRLTQAGGGRVEIGLINKIQFKLDLIKLKENKALVRVINAREDGTINGNGRLNLLEPLGWFSSVIDKRVTKYLGDQARINGSLNPDNIPGVLDSQMAEYQVDLNTQAGIEALDQILKTLRETETWTVLLKPDIKTNKKESDRAQREERIQEMLQFVSKAEKASAVEGSGVLKNAQASTQDDYALLDYRLPLFALASVNNSGQTTRSRVTDRLTDSRMLVLSRASNSGDGMLGAGKEVDLQMTLDAAFTVNQGDRDFQPQELKNFNITHFMYDQQGREIGFERIANLKPTVKQMQDLVRANLPMELMQTVDLSRLSDARSVKDASLQFSVYYGRSFLEFLRMQTVEQVDAACQKTLSVLSDEFLWFINRENDCNQMAKNIVRASTYPSIEKRAKVFNKLRKQRLFNLAFPGIASQLLAEQGLSSDNYMNVSLVLQDSNGIIAKVANNPNGYIKSELLENYRELRSALGQGKDTMIEVMRDNQ